MVVLLLELAGLDVYLSTHILNTKSIFIVPQKDLLSLFQVLLCAHAR